MLSMVRGVYFPQLIQVHVHGSMRRKFSGENLSNLFIFQCVALNVLKLVHSEGEQSNKLTTLLLRTK